MREMKGTLEKIGNKWFVRYVRSEGGGSFRLPLHPNFVEMTDFVYIKNERFYDGNEIDFTEALVNPMGRDVDPNDLGQNHSLCKWYARPYLVERGITITHKDEIKKLFTDYPITELGDEEFKEAPIRECELLFYDDNKYCYVKVEGIEKEIKRGYIYTKPGRCGEVDCISIDEINKLIEVNKQKQHLIDMMKGDEDLGLYNETFDEYLIRLKDRRTEDDYKYTDEDFEKYDEYIMDSWRCGMSVYKCLEFMYFAEKEIKVEDVFNDHKREGVEKVIQQHKVLQGLTLVNPSHLQMTSNGHGEFPDGYKLTEKGIQYIIEQLNKE